MQQLDRYSPGNFDKGVSSLVYALWVILEGMLFGTWLPGSAWRRALLRAFGAKIGRGVVIKPRVQIKFPWRLEIGDHSWIGERTWIDNLGPVHIGKHVCISQGVYLCTGSHNWSSDAFDLIVKPIVISDHSWVGAFSRVGPGVEVPEGSVLTLGSLAVRQDLEAWKIHSSPSPVGVKDRVRRPDICAEHGRQL